MAGGRPIERGDGFTLTDIRRYLEERNNTAINGSRMLRLVRAAGVELRMSQDPHVDERNYEPLSPQEATAVLQAYYRIRGERELKKLRVW